MCQVYFNFTEDYTIIDNNIEFSSTETTTSFCVTIDRDTILEGDETFNITAIAASPTARHYIKCNATTTVTILDDDSKSLFCISRATVHWE